MLRIKLVKSPIGNNWRNRRTVEALGLRRVHQVVEQPDNSSIRGMIHHVKHMVTFEVVEGEVAPKVAKHPMAAKPAAVSVSKPAPKQAAKPSVKPKKGAEAPIEEIPQPEADEKPKKAAAKKKTEENA